MALGQLEVHEIVERAVSKGVDVPEFQRDFVWDPEQVKRLAESLYRDYPIGSFPLWNSQEYQEAKTAEGAQASLWIVDGQQHTTGAFYHLAVERIGVRSLKQTEGAIPAEMPDRLKRLWEQRLAVAKKAQQVADFAKELSAFGGSFVSEKFDVD